MNNIFDTHAHYNDEAFASDREKTLGSLCESGILCVVNCGTDIQSSKDSLSLAEKYDFLYGAAGLHPEEVHRRYDGYLDDLKALCENPKCVAIGEIGLDYYWKSDNKELQKQVFREQISLANELNMPVIIHDREAHGDTLEILKDLKPSGVLHCFSGSADSMREAVKLGMYIGLGGAVTFKNAKKPLSVAAEVPLSRLLLETDCPYMAPVPMRGKRNDSTLIPYIAEVIAAVRGISSQEVIDTATENGKRLFNISL